MVEPGKNGVSRARVKERRREARRSLAGLGLLALGGLWSLWRLPACLKRVGSADRALARGMIGAVVGFGLWSALHWTVELPAVAISASALGGTWNRWIAGGTDLFVERGFQQSSVASSQ